MSRGGVRRRWTPPKAPPIPPDMRGHFRPDGLPKHVYTETEARAYVTENPGSNRRPNRAYLCKLCGSWHVGRKRA